MSTISAGTTSGTALVNTGDTSGNLELQSSGVTQLTVGSGGVTLASALPVGSGGTGATTLTANNVILGNGTSAVQLVAPGSTGNVLTSNGTTWASSPLSVSSGLTLLETVTASSSTTATLTAFSSTYQNYRILCIDMRNNSGSYQGPVCNIDFGSGYSGIPWSYMSTPGTGSAPATSNGTTPIYFTGSNLLNVSTYGASIAIDLTGRGSNNFGMLWTLVLSQGTSSGQTIISFGGASNYSSTSITGFRFSLSSNGAFSGTFKLYGYAN